MQDIIHSVLSHFNIPESEHDAHVLADARKGKGYYSLNKSAIRTYRLIYASLTREERHGQNFSGL